jgi:hypothetical protein
MDSLNNLQAAGLLYAYMWMFVIGSGAWMTLATLAAGLSIARISLGFGPTIKSTDGPIAVRIGLIPMGSYVTQPENEAGDFKPFPTGVRLACHAGNMAIPAIVVLLAIGAEQGVGLLESVAKNFIPATLSPLGKAPSALREFWATLKSTPTLALAQLAVVHVFLGFMSLILLITQKHDEGDNTLIGRVRRNLHFFFVALYLPWLVALVAAFF